MNSDQLVFYCVPIGHGISYTQRVKLFQYFKVKTTMDIPFLYIVCVIYRTIQLLINVHRYVYKLLYICLPKSNIYRTENTSTFQNQYITSRSQEHI